MAGGFQVSLVGMKNSGRWLVVSGRTRRRSWGTLDLAAHEIHLPSKPRSRQVKDSPISTAPFSESFSTKNPKALLRFALREDRVLLVLSVFIGILSGFAVVCF